MIRPFSPEPLTCDRLIPFSSAIFLAKGETKTLSFEVVVVGCSFIVVGCWLLVVGSKTVSTAAVLDPDLKFSAIPVISVPSGPIIASKESHGAVPPSGIPIYNNVPALKDSNSIVALSVSISARISPSETLSPTFFNHVATVPSVIVSLKRGIVTTTTPLGKVVDGCWLLVVGSETV